MCKKIILTILCLISLSVYGNIDIYKNKYVQRGRSLNYAVHSFRLVKKMNYKCGYFEVITNFINANGSSRIFHRGYILINYDLSFMNNGDVIKLKDDQSLYFLGSIRNENNSSVKVYSFKKDDNIVDVFKKDKKNKNKYKRHKKTTVVRKSTTTVKKTVNKKNNGGYTPSTSTSVKKKPVRMW